MNIVKFNPVDLLIKKNHQEKGKQKIEIKNNIDLTNIEKMEDEGIL